MCDKAYERERPGQTVCGFECAIEEGKRQQVLQMTEPYVTKPKKTNNSLAHQLALTQKVFNAWIRFRDKDKPCISSGRYTAAQFDAGHYRPCGGMGGSILRFDPWNCHKQCSEENQHKSGNLTAYRVNLIERIGLEQVERLENTNGTKKWDVDELKKIRRYYSKQLRELQDG